MQDSRTFAIHAARVYLVQARAFRLRNPKPDTFAIKLLSWAAHARRAATRKQLELFV